MQLKNSLLVLTALGASTAVARSHKHRHHHEERAVGDMVTATINGEVVSWVNSYSGEVTAAAVVEDVAASVVSSVVSEVTSAAASIVSDATASSGSSTTGSSSGSYCTDGFGSRTSSTTTSDVDTYVGNVGDPWGSNIITVTAAKASSYKYTVRFTGSNSEDWFVSIWNKIGPDGLMDGWYGHSAVNFTLSAGETVWVAFDENSQGGWGAAKGDSLPTNDYGSYDCTWGEFDFGNTSNDEWSGFDVSAIQAQNADATVQGMKICTSDGDTCSSIDGTSGTVSNAYTAALADEGGIGGNLAAGSVTLYAVIDWSSS
ncbi:MAG: hypothetical protein M1834_003207 [Cirrosporium novae-zelandiae]|nr:MAG: hypothetical protein M1834_003207 [Cirrosporium novae-zelandiae]